MPFLKHTRTNNIKESLKAFSAIIVLFLCVVGNIQVDIIHQFVHANQMVVAHSVEQEKDPCHISFYHEGRNGSCDHETHLTEVEKCSLCNLIIHSDQVVLSNTSSQFVHSYFFMNERVVSGLSHDIAAQLPSRAPPVLFLA